VTDAVYVLKDNIPEVNILHVYIRRPVVELEETQFCALLAARRGVFLVKRSAKLPRCLGGTRERQQRRGAFLVLDLAAPPRSRHSR
jgi:hypothetical protein